MTPAAHARDGFARLCAHVVTHAPPAAEAVDAAEDELYGDTTPHELPQHLRDPAERRRRLEEASAELERRAREKNKDAKRVHA